MVVPLLCKWLTYEAPAGFYVKWERSGSRILLTVTALYRAKISLREGYSFEDGDILKIIEKGTYAVIRD